MVLLFTVTLQAGHVQWHSGYEDAHKKALKEHKELLVVLFQSVSTVSGRLIQRTFQEQSYIDFLNAHYVAVLVFADQKQSYPIELLYTVEYPALFFLDAHEVYTHDALTGEVTPERLRSHLGLP